MDVVWCGGWVANTICDLGIYVEYLIEKPPKGGFFIFKIDFIVLLGGGCFLVSSTQRMTCISLVILFSL